MGEHPQVPGADALSRRPTRAAYESLIAHLREASVLSSTASLLGWDQETGMPRRGAPHRGQQRAQLARLVHQMRTDARLADWLATCEADSECMGVPDSIAAVNVRETRREFDRSRKLPVSLVEALARASSQGIETWKAARASSEFSQFAPSLDELLRLNRDKASCLGWGEGGEPWDALADAFEPGCTARQVEAVFAPLRERLVALVDRIAGSEGGPEPLDMPLPVDRQHEFVRGVIARLGFDFDRGRLDVSTHPFCSASHPSDVRLTTRFHENDLLDALGSTLHECGHGLYEQGLLEEHSGTPMGTAVSLGIHESQSRMWENQVGRSRSFWTWCAPELSRHFGLRVSPDAAYRAANRVERSLIRVEADEATYNLHIMLRFTIERALVNGSLPVAELPAAWNEQFRRDLGIEVPDDARGCLQDIHWSMSLFGYFPTYTLGNLYAAQLYDAAQAELGDLDAMFAAGEFAPLRAWLARHIHAQGRRYGAAALCERVTGRPLEAAPLLRYLEGKLLAIYGL